MKSEKRGGKRPNAGRKNLNSKIVQFSIPAHILEEFKREGKLLKEKLLKKEKEVG